VKRLTEFIILLSVVLCACGTAFSQVVTSQWVRVESENKEFSCVLPENFSVTFDKEGFSRAGQRDWADHVDFKNVRSFGGYSDGLSVFLEVYDVRNTKKGLAYITESINGADISQLQFESFTVRKVVSEGDTKPVSFYIASKSQIYVVGYGTRNPNNLAIARFLTSIRLDGKQLFTTKLAQFPETALHVSLSSVVETPIEVTENLESKKDAKGPKQKASQPASMPQNSKTGSPKDSSYSLAMLVKPRVSYTDSARQANEQGVIRLRVTFLANGHIGKIVVLKKLRFGLLENAIRCARRIKFIPEVKDNAAIDTEHVVEYSFSIY
jgi:hypothetical protein